MSSERYKKCPFCKSENIDAEFSRYEDGRTAPGCMDCGATADDWNDRPIEAALNAQIEKLKNCKNCGRLGMCRHCTRNPDKPGRDDNWKEQD